MENKRIFWLIVSFFTIAASFVIFGMIEAETFSWWTLFGAVILSAQVLGFTFSYRDSQRRVIVHQFIAKASVNGTGEKVAYGDLLDAEIEGWSIRRYLSELYYDHLICDVISSYDIFLIERHTFLAGALSCAREGSAFKEERATKLSQLEATLSWNVITSLLKQKQAEATPAQGEISVAFE
jgi:hypothetical protein